MASLVRKIIEIVRCIHCRIMLNKYRLKILCIEQRVVVEVVAIIIVFVAVVIVSQIIAEPRRILTISHNSAEPRRKALLF